MNLDMDLLSKENSKILRGLGIMAIILHNFSICPQFGLSACNEMSFSIENSMAYFSTFKDGNIITEFISFLGWTGVPVFVFLTGYGIASAPATAHLSFYKSISYIK